MKEGVEPAETHGLQPSLNQHTTLPPCLPIALSPGEGRDQRVAQQEVDAGRVRIGWANFPARDDATEGKERSTNPRRANRCLDGEGGRGVEAPGLTCDLSSIDLYLDNGDAGLLI